MAVAITMNNNYQRWDDTIPTNSKELKAKYKGGGYGGHRQHKRRMDWARIDFMFSAGNSFMSGTPSAGGIFKNGIQPTDMRSTLQRKIDSSKIASRATESFYKQNGRSNAMVTHGKPAVVQSSPTYMDLFSIMNSVGDVVLFKTEIGARVLKVNLPKVMSKAGIVTGAVGVGFSIHEAYTDPTWNNRAQAVTGTAILGTTLLIGAGVLTAPVWGTAATVGTVVLLAWELVEVIYVEINKR